MPTFTGTEGVDFIVDSVGDDVINALGGNDFIEVSGGFDTIFAGDGDDQLDTRSGPNQGFNADMGAGSDLVFVSSAVNSTFNLGSGNDWAQFRPFLGVVDTVTLGSGRDHVVTSFQAGGTQIFTDFETGAGGDILEFSTWYWRNGIWWDNFATLGASGLTNPFGAGRAQLIDSAGGALLQVRSQTADPWTTIATFQGRTAAQFHADNFRGWSPAGTAAVASTLNVIEMSAYPRDTSNLFRAPLDTYGDDIITATAGGGYITLSHGNDIVYAGAGNDQIIAGGVSSGRKTIYLGDGNDSASIGGLQFGSDRNGQPSGSTMTAVIYGGNGNDQIGGSWGQDEIYGEGGDDRLFSGGGSANDFISGGDGNDRIVGGGRFNGDAGNDELLGGGFVDVLDGGADNDIVTGNGDNDILTGGSGIDVLTGGPGADVFRDTAAGLNGDQIIDFSLGDTIHITDAAIASFSFSLSGSTLAYTGGSLTFGAAINGSFAARAASGGGVLLSLANLVTGTAGNDVLTATAADDVIDGLAGIDKVVFAGALAGSTYFFTDETFNILTPNGRDIVSNVELYQFADGIFTFRFSNPDRPVVANFAVGAGGWSSQDRFPRQAGDVNGDGFADIVGFGQAGTLVSLGSGDGNFAAPILGIANFGVDQGWSSDNSFHRELVDVNNDGREDIVGFGTAGVLVSLAQANGTFGAVSLRSGNFNPANGWTTQDAAARTLADVNGDGFADIVGFGTPGTFVALGTASGTFGPASLAVANFGRDQGWTSNNVFHREVGDVNGDGRADIVGFGTFGTLVALGQSNGSFGEATLALNNFGTNQGWSTQDVFTRDLADVNGDGRDDVVGFGVAGTFVAFGQTNGGISEAGFDVANFGRNQGWTSDNVFHREMADYNGDGRADIFGFGFAGVLLATSFNPVMV